MPDDIDPNPRRPDLPLLVILSLADGTEVRHPVWYSGESDYLENAWRRKLREAARVELRDVDGASIVVACDTVADVAIAANEAGTATRPPGASATWFYHGSMRPLPKDVTTRSPILPPE